MKKTTIGVIIVALVMIVAGIGLCIGGIAVAGGVEAARDEIFRSGIDWSHVHRIEIDEDGLDIDFDIRDHDIMHHHFGE